VILSVAEIVAEGRACIDQAAGVAIAAENAVSNRKALPMPPLTVILPEPAPVLGAAAHDIRRRR